VPEPKSKPKWTDDHCLSDGSEVAFPGDPGYAQWCEDLAKEQSARRAAADARLAAKRAAQAAAAKSPAADGDRR